MRKIFFIIISLFFFMAIPFISNASVFFFMPQSAEYQRSDTFIKTLYIDTESRKINTIESKINFDEDILEAIDIITEDSVVKFWAKTPTISNENGSIEFTGGIPGGYEGEGVILKVIFKAKKTGSCELNLSDTKTLLDDGAATEDKISLSDDNYDIVEKSASFVKIESKSNPDENKWSSSDTLSLHWDLVDKVDYSYILSKDSLIEPDEIPDKPEGKLVWMGDMSYKGLEDGIYYFHLKQKLPNENWSPKITIRIMMDATSPEELMSQTIDIEGKKYLVFFTTDATSGIDHYEVLEIPLDWFGNIKSDQETEWKIVKSPYLLEDQSLKSITKIKAIDKAGNERSSEIVLYSKPKFSPYQIIFLILAGIIIIVLIARKLFLRRIKFMRLPRKKG